MNNTPRKVMNPALVGLAGVVAGVVAGILLAPKSGKETREDLSKLAEKMKNDVTEQVRKMTDVTREKYQEIVEAVTSKYEKAKDITQEEAQDLKQEFSRRYDQVKEAAEQDTRRSKRSNEK